MRHETGDDLTNPGLDGRLEEIERAIREPPHPEMDMMQVLAVSGLWPSWIGLEGPAARYVQDRLRGPYETRRRSLPANMKKIETRTSYALRLAYDDGNGIHVKTIRDLDAFLASRGYGCRYSIPHLGPAGRMHLNQVFSYYGLPTIPIVAQPSHLNAAAAALTAYMPLMLEPGASSIRQ